VRNLTKCVDIVNYRTYNNNEQGGIRMKKILILIAVAIMTLSGCAPAAPAPVVSKVGTASVTTIGKRDATAEVPGRVQVNVTTATVVLDKDGKFVSVVFDVAQNEGTFGIDGVVIANTPVATKKEKGAAYNMKASSAIGKEWDEQIFALEAWMVGKTLAEVKALPVVEGRVKEGEDLRSSVSVRIVDYMAALEKAVAAAVEVTNLAKIGAESVTTIGKRDATAEVPGRVQVNTTFTAVVLDTDGKVLHVFFDVAQNEGTFGIDGVVIANTPVATKREKGAAYNMKASSAIGKEWDEQIFALEAWMIGKTLTEVKALPIEEGKVKEGEDLRSSVSIRVGDYWAAFEKAYNAAK